MATVVVVATACGGSRSPAVLGTEVSGCPDALRARAEATSQVDGAERQAVERNGARAAELQVIASEAKHALVAAADLGPCEDPSGKRGVAVDLADLRARYRVIVDRATARLAETAAKPAPSPVFQPQRGRNANTKGKSKD